MRNLLFVHGTGVRETSFKLTVEFIASEMRGELPHVITHDCYWGDLGAVLHQNGDSIPTYSVSRAVDGSDPNQESLSFWRLLYEDPLLELRFLATRTEQLADVPPNIDVPSAQLEKKLRAIEPSGPLIDLMTRHRLFDLWPDAVATVQNDPTTAIAIGVNQVDTIDSSAALSRAIVASLLSVAGASERPLPDGGTRDRLVGLVMQEFGGQPRSPARWLGGQLVGLAASGSSYWIKRKRGVISDAGTPAMGDVLLYQTRGEAIRARIRKRVLEIARSTNGDTEPIIIFGAQSRGHRLRRPVSSRKAAGQSSHHLRFPVSATLRNRRARELPIWRALTERPGFSAMAEYIRRE